MTEGGVPVAALGCARMVVGASAAAPIEPAIPLTTARLDAPVLRYRYFQLARKNLGSSSGYGLKLSCFEKP
jgi:hypothetical protein